MNATTGIQAYANVGLETSVTAADPHKLILLLYQGALLAIGTAKSQMQRKEAQAKGKSITHAIRIIDRGLKASLDKNAGGDLAQNLSNLYDYMCQRLLVANLKDDGDALDEVSRLLSDLKGAWEEIRPQAMPQASAMRTPATAPVKKENALTYGRT